MDERTLRILFDLQKFEQNSALQTVLGDVLHRYEEKEPVPLEDDALEFVAAGVQEVRGKKNDGQGTI